jgi:hypothetical protein
MIVRRFAREKGIDKKYFYFSNFKFYLFKVEGDLSGGHQPSGKLVHYDLS